MEKQNPNLKVINTITDDAVNWSGRKGRIDEKMIREFVNDFNNTIFYTCGPPAMVEGISQLLKSMYVPQQNVKIEKFVGY